MDLKRPESHQPIPPHASRVFKGVIYDIYQWEQVLFDGTKTTFEKAKRADTTVVFPILPDGTILLTRQQQPGSAGFSYCGAGGRVEEGEDPFDTAVRELREETGHEAGEWVLWDAVQPMGKLDWAVYILLAKQCKKVTEISPDAGEKIEVLPVTFEEFLDIATLPNFAEKEVVPRVLAAKADPKKMIELQTLFRP